MCGLEKVAGIFRHGLSALFLAWVIGANLVACANDPGSALQTSGAKGVGVIVGRVTIGPLPPVGGSGVLGGPAPVPGARIVVSELNGRAITSVVTDGKGDYRISLPPGTYRVDMAPLRAGRTKDLPATVTLTEGQEIRLDIFIDTGIYR